MAIKLPDSWESVIQHPITGREKKPRQKGLTMIIDKGLGLNQTKDLLETGSNYFDTLKLGFGTSALYPTDILLQKIELVKSYGIDIYPGGTFFEVAMLQGKLDLYLKTAKSYGFTTIEISDGTINLAPALRKEAIEKAVAAGFKVVSEVGKKDANVDLNWREGLEEIKADLKAGAFKVIIEGRESGKGVGMYDKSGDIKKETFTLLYNEIDTNFLVFEAPLKSQQEELIRHFGPNVNLGNINPVELIALESLRIGLRGDTLKLVLENVD